jgi:hypothetical protein
MVEAKASGTMMSLCNELVIALSNSAAGWSEALGLSHKKADCIFVTS